MTTPGERPHAAHTFTWYFGPIVFLDIITALLSLSLSLNDIEPNQTELFFLPIDSFPNLFTLFARPRRLMDECRREPFQSNLRPRYTFLWMLALYPPPFILSLLFPVDTSKRAGGKEQTLATTLQTNVFLSSPFPLFSHHFSSARNSSASAEAFFIRPSADANILLPQLPTEFR
jgi:hypothetical protein